MQTEVIEKEWDKLEIEIKAFQQSFNCKCDCHTVWPDGTKICKHLIKAQKYKFNKKILKIIYLEDEKKNLV